MQMENIHADVGTFLISFCHFPISDFLKILIKTGHFHMTVSYTFELLTTLFVRQIRFRGRKKFNYDNIKPL